MDFTSSYPQHPHHQQQQQQPPPPPFPADQVFHRFMPIPPLTPSHSHSANSDDFNPSPPDSFDALPQGELFQSFDYTQGLDPPHQTPAFSTPPTPPNNGIYHARYHQPQQHAQQHPQLHRPPDDERQQAVSFTNTHTSGLLDRQHSEHGADQLPASLAKLEPGAEDLGQAQAGNDDADDDETLTPAQARRKAQNRAAQRAFRERKEKHVKDLESKLASLEAAQQEASWENERLKRDLHKISTENEILRATSNLSRARDRSPDPEPVTTGPMQYNPTDFYSSVLQNHTNKQPSHRIVTASNGEQLLAAGATWDFIISHDLYKRGLVDVASVSHNLKNKARCDGQGPVFSEGDIVRAIEQSVVAGSDELM